MISKEIFGTLESGASVDIFTLRGGNSEVKITNYGGRIVSWIYKGVNVVLGYENLDGYVNDGAYLGAIVGRCANRIGDAKFTLNGVEYFLDKNDGGKNHLHGGFSGFEKKIWAAEIIGNTLKLICESPDGEGGYPANLTATVVYELTDDDELKINYSATADGDTICNLTNHSYFNLDGSQSILGHKIQIFSDKFTWANSESIPDGRILNVEGTPMDLRKLTAVGEHIDDDFDELKFAAGYDHNWCIANYDGHLRKAAQVVGENGVRLMVFTTLLGVHFYAGNFLPVKRSGLALETQYYPNAINLENFPQPILRGGETWTAQTIFKLSVGTENEKRKAGKIYDPFDDEITTIQQKSIDAMNEFNTLGAGNRNLERKLQLMKEMLGAVGENSYIEPPFYANWGGRNLFLGKNVYVNFGLTVVDDVEIVVGDYVMFGPNVTIATANHPINPDYRRLGYQYAKKIVIGNNAWIGANAILLPGVTIGENSVIGAGSVVTKNIPPNVVAVGNPCRVTKEING